MLDLDLIEFLLVYFELPSHFHLLVLLHLLLLLWLFFMFTHDLVFILSVISGLS